MMNPVAAPNEDWERQRAFLAVLRAGSLSGAARALDLAQPTVRRRIEELESGLGAALFTRTATGLVPTERALMLREHADAMALAADAFVRSARAGAGEVAGTVRIGAGELVAAEILPPILAALRIVHPGVAILLSAHERDEHLHRDTDIAVRTRRPREDALVARWIGAVPLGLHAHRDYLARHGTPDQVGELARHALLGTDTESGATLRHALHEHGVAIRREDFAFRSNSDLAHLSAIRAGLGIGLCHAPLAARDPALVRLLPGAIRPDLEIWVVAHEDRRGVARIRATLDALAAGLAAYIGRPALQRPAPAGWLSPG
jgi:DNA-binding transcriptional LysR family regulator